MYKIDYRTRAESQYYLENIEENLGEQENKNIDFYFMKNAYNVINSWICGGATIFARCHVRYKVLYKR